MTIEFAAIYLIGIVFGVMAKLFKEVSFDVVFIFAMDVYIYFSFMPFLLFGFKGA